MKKRRKLAESSNVDLPTPLKWSPVTSSAWVGSGLDRNNRLERKCVPAINALAHTGENASVKSCMAHTTNTFYLEKNNFPKDSFIKLFCVWKLQYRRNLFAKILRKLCQFWWKLFRVLSKLSKIVPIILPIFIILTKVGNNTTKFGYILAILAKICKNYAKCFVNSNNFGQNCQNYANYLVNSNHFYSEMAKITTERFYNFGHRRKSGACTYFLMKKIS